MKFKKIAAKIASLALITTICACTNVFAVKTTTFQQKFGQHYPVIGHIKDYDSYKEVVIEAVCGDKYKDEFKKDYKNNLLSDWGIFFKEEREISKLQDISDVRKVCCEGIVYEYNPAAQELIIHGTSGCCPYPRESALKILSVMHLGYAVPTTEKVLDQRTGKWKEVQKNVPAYTGNHDKIKKVKISGNIRFILDFFLSHERYRAKSDSDPGCIHPKIIDLSKSNVEMVGLRALNVAGLNNIILPNSCVTFITTLPADYRGRSGDRSECEIGSPDCDVLMKNGENATFECVNTNSETFVLMQRLFSTIRPTPSIFDCCRI